MPDDEHDERKATTTRRQGISAWFALPPPLKRLFDQFPLRTYEHNDFPISASRSTERHALYVFTSVDAARYNAPSFNPGCLRWQTYLKIKGIEFHTVPSNNHASPTGSLPFLVTASRGGSSLTVSTKSFRKWIAGQKKTRTEETPDVGVEAYEALIDGRLRLAWLYQLYICRANAPVVRHLYLASASSNSLVQLAIAHQLRQAAETELRRSSFLRRREEEELWRECSDAFFALSTLLGERMWFFGDSATYFDASVFAYTHLILDSDTMHWRLNRMAEMLGQHENLVRHRDRILEMYY